MRCHTSPKISVQYSQRICFDDDSERVALPKFQLLNPGPGILQKEQVIKTDELPLEKSQFHEIKD